MANQSNTYDIQKAKTTADSGSLTAAQNLLKNGTDAYGKAEQVVGEAYDKPTQKVNETYKKGKGSSGENPGKTVLIFRPDIPTRRQRPPRYFTGVFAIKFQ